MKHLKPYNEKKEDGELKIVDEICMDLFDNNLKYRTECHEYGKSRWTSRTAFLNVNIFPDRTKKDRITFGGDEVVDVIERLYYYMVKDRSWIMRVDATLYNDNHLNNGCLMFQYLTEKRLGEFLDIFRDRNINFNFDGSSAGFKHIKIEFTK